MLRQKLLGAYYKKYGEFNLKSSQEHLLFTSLFHKQQALAFQIIINTQNTMLPSCSDPKSQKNTTVSASTESQKVRRIPSQDELHSLRNIIPNIKKCNAQLCDFRTEVENNFQQFRAKGVQIKRLNQVSLTIKVKAKYFASAFCLLQTQLQKQGLDIPEIGDINLLLESFRLSTEKQAIFFHEVSNFFDRDAPNAQEKTAIKQYNSEQENHSNLVLTLSEFNQLFYKLRKELAYIQQKMRSLCQIFFRLLKEIDLDHRYQLIQIYRYSKDSHAESILLERYALHIYKMVEKAKKNSIIETNFKSNARNSQQKPIMQMSKSIAQEKKKSQPHLTFKQKAYNYLQTLFNVLPFRQQIQFQKEDQQQYLCQYKYQ